MSDRAACQRGEKEDRNQCELREHRETQTMELNRLERPIFKQLSEAVIMRLLRNGAESKDG